MKTIEFENPWVPGGRTVLRVERETKNYYIVRYNEKATGKFRKPTKIPETDCIQVYAVPYESFAHRYILHITPDDKP